MIQRLNKKMPLLLSLQNKSRQEYIFIAELSVGEDLPIGAKIRVGIDEAIRRYDKLLLILSENSVNSQWAEQEVETALEKERERKNQVVLFPVRLDDAVRESGDGWTRLIKNTRNIGDFSRWKDHDAYQRSFERLGRDLKAALVAKE